MSEKEKKGPMKGSAYAVEPEVREEIKDKMGHLDLSRSNRYRVLTIIGLDEYAISSSELRKKRFPIKNEIGDSFTVMLPTEAIKEIEVVKKKRNQTKRLAIRYIILLGFEKWKKDNLEKDSVEGEEEVEEVEEVEFEVLDEEVIIQHVKPVNDNNIGEKFQALIDLINDHDLKITIEKK